MDELYRFANLSYAYPGSEKKVLKNLEFSIRKGEFLAISGPNDGGKSTLCRLLTGVIPHSQGGTIWGDLLFKGRSLPDMDRNELIPRLGIVLDDPDAQLFTPSVDDEICFSLENRGLPPEEIDKALLDVKISLGLEEWGDFHPGELSGGQKQKVLLAAALAGKPEVLILDEPCTQLDPQNTREIFTVLERMNREKGTTVILFSHRSGMMETYASRLLILDRGRIRDEGTPGEILNDREKQRRFSLDAPHDPPLDVLDGREESSHPQLRIENLSFTYPNGREALKDINLSIAKGDFLALIGPNGSGKSTLLKCLLTLLSPSEGRILLNGRDMGGMALSDLAYQMGYVQQNPDRQLFSYTLADEIAFGPRNLGVKNRELDHRVNRALADLELTPLREEYPPGLSRANRSRTAFASVLAMNPSILILDEPTGSQDNRGKLLMLEIVKKLNEQGVTVILVTHHMKHVGRYARRAVFLDKGRLIRVGALNKEIE